MVSPRKRVGGIVSFPIVIRPHFSRGVRTQRIECEYMRASMAETRKNPSLEPLRGIFIDGMIAQLSELTKGCDESLVINLDGLDLER